MNVARWFLFVDGRAGITYDDSGSPTGLDAVIIAIRTGGPITQTKAMLSPPEIHAAGSETKRSGMRLATARTAETKRQNAKRVKASFLRAKRASSSLSFMFVIDLPIIVVWRP